MLFIYLFLPLYLQSVSHVDSINHIFDLYYHIDLLIHPIGDVVLRRITLIGVSSSSAFT